MYPHQGRPILILGAYFHPAAAWSTTYCDKRWISSSESLGPNVHRPCTNAHIPITNQIRTGRPYTKVAIMANDPPLAAKRSSLGG